MLPVMGGWGGTHLCHRLRGIKDPERPPGFLLTPSYLFSLINAYITRRKLFVLIHNLICLSFLERDTSF
jgi:hypothetical protein